jgi:hypothetical protein
MSKRGVVTDYAGEELYTGDLVSYATRQGNRVRQADAVILRVTTRLEYGRVRPLLLVQPTGIESGFAKRRTMRQVWISAEHVRLLRQAVVNV